MTPEKNTSIFFPQGGAAWARAFSSGFQDSLTKLMINVSLHPRTIQGYDVFKMETAAHDDQSQPLCA